MRLDDPSLTTAIFQGLITSADHIYHLERLGVGRYKGKPNGKNAVPNEVEIEDAIMKPLVSGPEAKRYEAPETDTYLLFPYERDARGVMRLISAGDMARRFPKAWAHLRRWEKELRGRESDKMDRDNDWWGYVYPKNLDKHDLPKLVVAQTVPELRVCGDFEGAKYLNNVRVNGLLPAPRTDQLYLLGALNGPVADFIFRRIGKPKQGGLYEANKQFIAPLPIPKAPPEARAVSRSAGRTAAISYGRRPNGSLCWRGRAIRRAGCGPICRDLGGPRRAGAWRLANRNGSPQVGRRTARRNGGGAHRGASIRAGWWRRREARFEGGELCLYFNGAIVLHKIYLDETVVRLAEAYWRWLLLSGPSREAKLFAADLRRPPAPNETAAAIQFIDRVATLAVEVDAIAVEERALNDILYDLYRLTPDERNLVENDPSRRNVLLAGA